MFLNKLTIASGLNLVAVYVSGFGMMLNKNLISAGSGGGGGGPTPNCCGVAYGWLPPFVMSMGVAASGWRPF